MEDPVEEIKAAFHRNDARRVDALLNSHPALRERINDPNQAFGGTPILCAAQRGWREMIDVLLRHGADINARSQWWAGGFGILDFADAELAQFLIGRGATVDVHAAAHLGKLDVLERLIRADPQLVHARGGDGKMPLHFAGTVEIAHYLLDHGAEIDARDIDHESTPAQYMVKGRQDVSRYLVGRGCQTDILMAAALGDLGLVRKHLEANPEAIRMRVSDEYFPLAGPNQGGTIYQWELGWYVSSHQVARKFGHEGIYQNLMERTPAEERLLVACWLHDEKEMARLLKEHPDLAKRLSPAGRRHAAYAAHNDDIEALRLMLLAGLPVDTRGRHGATALHWAATHGNGQMTRLLLRYSPPLEALDEDFHATPLGWAIHGSKNGWHGNEEESVVTVRALLEAGAKPPEKAEGSAAVREVLREHGVRA